MILVVTVRGSTDDVGFLADARQMNVMLTRAKEMLLVVGNISGLGKHSGLWRSIHAQAIIIAKAVHLLGKSSSDNDKRSFDL